MSAGLAEQAGADDLREVVLELLVRHLGGSVSGAIPGYGPRPQGGREGEHPGMSTLRGSRCVVGLRRRFLVVR